jgi:hypothetical protein
VRRDEGGQCRLIPVREKTPGDPLLGGHADTDWLAHGGHAKPSRNLPCAELVDAAVGCSLALATFLCDEPLCTELSELFADVGAGEGSRLLKSVDRERPGTER